MKLHVYPNPTLVAAAAAKAFVGQYQATKGSFHVVLSGGRTPKQLFERLRTEELDWSRLHVWLGDERVVPQSDPASNFGTAWESWLRHVAIPPSNLHPMVRDASLAPTEIAPPEVAPSEIATVYEAELKQFKGDQPFDLVWLGLGTDAHTASLFPGQPGVHVVDRLVVDAQAPVAPHQRISLTPPALRDARRIEFLIAGADKVPALELLRSGPEDWSVAPSQAIARHHDNVLLRVDESSLA